MEILYGDGHFFNFFQSIVKIRPLGGWKSFFSKSHETTAKLLKSDLLEDGNKKIEAVVNIVKRHS